jgi:hypothetical protein
MVDVPLQQLMLCCLPFIVIVPAPLQADTAFTSQTAAGIYQDKALRSKKMLLGVGSEFTVFGEGNEYLSSISTNFQNERLEKVDEEEAKNLELNDGDHAETSGASVNINQTIRLLTNLSIGYSQSRSLDVINSSESVGVDRWIFPDLVRIGFSYAHNKVNQDAQIYTDVDGKQVATPDKIDGNNYQLRLMGYAAADAIVLANYSLTTRTDRPSASAASTEIRQYIAPAKASLHLGLAHYENVGSIRPITTYGSIVSNQLFSEWHQKLGQNYILMGGYRFYVETERPRANPDAVKTTGSDYIYSTLRYRFQKGWTYRSSELNITSGRYLTNAGLSGFLCSLGLDLVI